jgi:hypothetical protein
VRPAHQPPKPVVVVEMGPRQNPNQEDPKVSWVVIRLRPREPAMEQKTHEYKKNLAASH